MSRQPYNIHSIYIEWRRRGEELRRRRSNLGLHRQRQRPSPVMQQRRASLETRGEELRWRRAGESFTGDTWVEELDWRRGDRELHMRYEYL
ncbi:hypothetical protein F2Q69_00033620 [Brassica cretica]|uniref:Uncharacterized protein n=1 Tax=Brassica cretica TaxID=69181 RepID=A0A8S9SSM1_BRACR|nr:hypothetical protein F2Q69_00033620 [Brassica cretica]